MMCCAWRRWALLGCVVGGATCAAAGQETCQTATPVVVGTPLVGSNALAADDAQFGLCAVTSRDVWHTFTPALAGVHTMSLCGSGFDTVLALYDNCVTTPLICDDDSCGLQSQIVLTLNAGQPYWLRVGALGAGGGGAGGSYRLTVSAPAASPPINNSCGAPIALPQNTTVFGNSAGATGTDASATCGDLDRADVWYNYAPQASGLHIIELCSTAFDTVLTVRTSCVFSSVIACSDDAAVATCGGVGSRVAFNATVGQPFLVRVAGANDSFGPFELRMFTAQRNDLCENAMNLTTGVALAGAVTPAVGTEAGETCVDSGSDVWYSYIARVTSAHTFSVCDANFDSVLSVYSACPNVAGAVELGCDDNGCGSSGPSRLTVDLTVGLTYYVRVAGKVSGGTLSHGSFSVLAQVTPPTNDLCANALPLGVGLPVMTGTSGATGTDITSCGQNDAVDVWYWFSPPASGMYEFNTCGSVIDTTLGLYNSCNGGVAAQIACSDDTPALCGPGSKGAGLVSVLNSGQLYFVRVAGTMGVMGRFRLSASRVPAPNDSCESASPPPALPVGVLTGGSLTGATASGVSACAGENTVDVFYSLTPVETRAFRIDTCGSGFEYALSVHSSCPGLPGSALLACSTFDLGECGGGTGSAVTLVLRAGATYVVRIAGRSLGGENVGSYQVLVTPVDPPNDVCDRATALGLDAPQIGTTIGATGTDLTLCGVNDTLDAWFAFVPELSGSYEFSTCTPPMSAPLDTTLSIFEGCPGAPGATGVPIVCNDDDAGMCASGSTRLSRGTARLEVGREVLIRVAGVGGAQGSFSLVANYARPSNDLCISAQQVVAGTYVYDTLGATTDPITADASCGLQVNPVQNDVWFRYTPPISGAVTVNACNSTFDTVMLVSLADGGCAAGLTAVVACNDDYDCDSNPDTADVQSRVAFAGVAGRPYLIRVGSRVGQRGAGEVRVTQPGTAPPCPCDWNNSGNLTLQDLFDFLNGWFAGVGDFNGSGQTTLSDIFDYLGCYLAPPAGC